MPGFASQPSCSAHRSCSPPLAAQRRSPDRTWSADSGPCASPADRLAGRPLAVAGDPQRGVRRAGARLGLRRRSRSPPGGAGAALEAMRALGIAGLSVTTPHKEDVAAAVDALAPAASALRSVNTVVRSATATARRPQHRRRRVRRLARRRRRRRRRGASSPSSAPARRRAASSTPSAAPAPPRSSSSTARRRGPRRRRRWRRSPGSARPPTSPAPTSSSTPRRSASAPTTLPFDPALLRAGQVVADLVYHPLRTALLDAAARARVPHGRRPRHARPPGRPPAAAVDRRPPGPRRDARRRRSVESRAAG